jgi:predicted phosphodiesterase
MSEKEIKEFISERMFKYKKGAFWYANKFNITEAKASEIIEDIKRENAGLKPKRETKGSGIIIENGKTGHNILVISDLHIPCEIPNALEKCINIKNKYNCTEVIFIGDIVDNYYLSIFQKDVNYNSNALTEVEIARDKIKEWYTAFPQATVLMGNHDQSRLLKLAKIAQIPSIWLRDLKDVLGVPNWNFTPEYESNGIYFNHGEVDSADKVALYRNQSTTQGHRHSECYINYIKDGVFAMQVGSLCDKSKAVFDYAKMQLRPWVNSVGVIIDKQPILINV